MPFLIPSVGTLAETLGAIAANILPSIANSLVSLAVKAISAALTPAPDRRKLKQRRNAQLITVREPKRTRELVYGATRKGGTYAFMGTTDEGRELHLVIMLAGHELYAINEVYFDEILAFDSAGVIQPSFHAGGLDKAFISKNLGSEDQGADMAIVSGLTESTGAITNATQAGPVVVTSSGHGLSTDATVYLNDFSTALRDLLDLLKYRWTLSSSGTNEYYLEAFGGGTPGVEQPSHININGIKRPEGTAGSLAAGEWDWADNDSLGFSTVYVRLFDEDDPENKPLGHVEHAIAGLTRLDLINGYSWLISASGTDEYYVNSSALSLPDFLKIDGGFATRGTVGSLNAGEWDYGDNDTLGFDTIYVRLTSGEDPDDQEDGFVEHGVWEYGMTELNDREFRVDVIDADTFSLRDEAGGSYNPYISGGKWSLRPWTLTHRLRGIAYIYARLTFERGIYDAVPVISANVQGRGTILDPRTGLTGYTNNAALCVADYLAHAEYGLNAPYGTEISTDDLIAAANICDESAPHPDGTETRYTCNGIIDSGDLPRRNIEILLSSMAGRLVYVGGMWIIKAAAYETPTIELDEDDVRGNISIRATTPRRDVFNAVRGTFVSEKTLYQPADFPPVTSETYLEADNNDRIWRDIELPMTATETMAQRIARIELEIARREIAVTVGCSLKGMQVRAGDTIMLTLARMAWTRKPFYVEKWSLTTRETDDVPVLETQLELREVDSAAYDIEADDISLIEQAPLVTIDNPGDAITLFTYQVEDLSAGSDISPARSIRTTSVKEDMTAANILSQGTPAGIDNSNTCVVNIYKNSTLVTSLTFDSTTPFPAAGASAAFTSFAAQPFNEDDVMKIEVVNGTTADPPAFVFQAQMEER